MGARTIGCSVDVRQEALQLVEIDVELAVEGFCEVAGDIGSNIKVSPS
jgi:hypothetical protein